MPDINKLATLCTGKTVYIQTHNFPDPDAIASAFGLQHLLSTCGVDAEICYEGRIDKLSTAKMVELLNIDVHVYSDLRAAMRHDDLIICVDSQKNTGNTTDFIGNEVACIDHHPTIVPANYLYSDIRMVGACASLIAEYYHSSEITPPPDVATALLYGIKMDTAQFVRGVTPLDIRMFAFLLPLCDDHKMFQLEHNNMEFSDLRAYAAAIDNIRLYGSVAFSRIPFACPDALIAILSDFMLSLEEVEVVVIYSERADGFKLSVRSERSDIHAGQLVRTALEGFGDGGGHPSMAGGLIPRSNLGLLGDFPDDALRDAFLAAMGSKPLE